MDVRLKKQKLITVRRISMEHDRNKRYEDTIEKRIRKLYKELIDNLYDCTLYIKKKKYCFRSLIFFDCEREQYEKEHKDKIKVAHYIIKKHLEYISKVTYKELLGWKVSSKDLSNALASTDLIDSLFNRPQTTTVTHLMPVTPSELPACYAYNHMTIGEQQEYLKSLNVPEDRQVFVYPCTFNGCHNNEKKEWKEL